MHFHVYQTNYFIIAQNIEFFLKLCLNGTFSCIMLQILGENDELRNLQNHFVTRIDICNPVNATTVTSWLITPTKTTALSRHSASPLCQVSVREHGDHWPGVSSVSAHTPITFAGHRTPRPDIQKEFAGSEIRLKSDQDGNQIANYQNYFYETIQ